MTKDGLDPLESTRNVLPTFKFNTKFPIYGRILPHSTTELI